MLWSRYQSGQVFFLSKPCHLLLCLLGGGRETWIFFSFPSENNDYRSWIKAAFHKLGFLQARQSVSAQRIGLIYCKARQPTTVIINFLPQFKQSTLKLIQNQNSRLSKIFRLSLGYRWVILRLSSVIVRLS